MPGQQILLVVFSFLPFVVCLFWLICFVASFAKVDVPKRYLMAYLTACVVLYLCHGVYFTHGLPYEMECLWTLCSLSVYPLYYGYLCRLTSSDYSVRKLLPWLVPGTLVALAKYFLPDAGIDRVRLLLFACQIVAVCYWGIKRLKAFDRELQTIYVDMEGRETTTVHHMLVAIIAVSILAGVANGVGKHFFGESLWLLVTISLAFSTMQYALSYIGFFRDFTIDTLNYDMGPEDNDVEPANESAEQDSSELIGKKIEELMMEQHYFLRNDLKIGDIVKATGVNRTYVSAYINTKYNCSFSDYMNRLRIEYAERRLMSMPKGTKFTQIAAESGFSNEQSFYRNFKKFTGMTPTEWVKAHQS